MIGRTNAGGKTVRAVGLAITTPPTKVNYSVDETLDLTGLVVTAAYSDGTTQDVTSECAFSPAAGTVLNTGHTAVTITWKRWTLTQAISVTDVHIYGVYWDGTSGPAMTRTDDAENFVDPVPYVSGASAYSSPFDNLQPWAGMTVVDDAEAGKLVRIPKFWYKWTRSGDSMKLQIADKATEGFLVSPAHADRGDGSGERDVVYVGRYHCSSSNYKSATGVSPKANITRATARSSIAALGTTIWQWDYAMLWTIRMLYLVEFANWNSQTKIGYGCSDSGSVQNSGLTDSMPYHTGTTKTSRTTYGHTQYRYIEDLWGNVLDWCDGIYFSGSTIYCIKNPASFSDTSGGTNVGTRATDSNCIKKWTAPSVSGFEYALYPSEVVSDSNYGTYACDYCYYHSSGVVLLVGGYYSQDQYCGLFCTDGSSTASDADSSIGCRLQKLPRSGRNARKRGEGAFQPPNNN